MNQIIKLVNSGINAHPQQFHYPTAVLPVQLAVNQTSLSILLEESSIINMYFFPNCELLTHSVQLIYRLYTYIDPIYESLLTSCNHEHDTIGSVQSTQRHSI